MHLCCSEKKNQDTFSDSSWVVPLLKKYKQMFGVLPHHSDLKLTLIQSDRCKRQVWGRRASYSWPPSNSSQASSCTLTPPRLTGEGRLGAAGHGLRQVKEEGFLFVGGNEPNGGLGFAGG